MSAVQTISLPDAAATPVVHNFIPIGPDEKGAWWYEDQSGASAIGYNRIRLQLVKPLPPGPNGSSGNNRMNRIKLGLYTPKLETLGNNSAGITPPPTISYELQTGIEFIVPERSILLDRKDQRKYVVGLLGDPQVVAMIESLQNVY